MWMPTAIVTTFVLLSGWVGHMQSSQFSRKTGTPRSIFWPLISPLKANDGGE